MDKQIISGRGSAKSLKILNTVVMLLENQKLKEALKSKEQECEEWKHQAELGSDTTDRFAKELEEKEKELENMREIMHKDICSHYVLGECSQSHHNKCVGKNQCIKDLEQECERLKEENFTFEQLIKEIEKHGAIEEILQQLDQLKAENEKQKEFRKLLEEQMEFNRNELELALSSEIKRSEFLLKEFQKVDKQKDNWREQAEKYSQTLTEIKEIIHFNKTNRLSGGACISIEQILQKISECEVQDVSSNSQ